MHYFIYAMPAIVLEKTEAVGYFIRFFENILNKTMLLIYTIKLSIDYEKYRPNIF